MASPAGMHILIFKMFHCSWEFLDLTKVSQHINENHLRAIEEDSIFHRKKVRHSSVSALICLADSLAQVVVGCRSCSLARRRLEPAGAGASRGPEFFNIISVCCITNNNMNMFSCT